jgi:6-phosphogluconolactonase
MLNGLRFPRRAALTGALGLALAALGAGASSALAHSAGAAYTLTNDPGGNAVKVFERAGDGSLSPGGEFATGGTGTGTGLGNQGGLVRDGRRLFAVNPGSDSISSFRIHGRKLELIDTDASGGDQPISLTVHHGLLYVLNAGGPGNITGHRISRHGALSPLVGSTRPLSGAATGPAQIEFDPRGATLVVTEKNTNLIDTYEVNHDTGLASGPNPQPSAGTTPFGFAFDRRGHLIVSEAFGGAANASAVSSYNVEGGIISPISPSVATTETAACWIVVTKNGRFTYTTNTGSASISGYGVGRDGALTPLDADGETGLTGAGPIDMALTRSSRFLYSLNSGDGTISGFRVHSDGSLDPIGETSGVPGAATGLVAR